MELPIYDHLSVLAETHRGVNQEKNPMIIVHLIVLCCVPFSHSV